MSQTQTPIALPKQRKTAELTQKELNLLAKTSNLSVKEIKLWHQEFLQKYPTGQLDKNTFAEAYKKFYPNEKVEVATEAFNSADKNKDGAIDFNELLFVAAIGSRAGTLDERLDSIFDLWDVSNDGQLDTNELGHLISAIYDRAKVHDRQGDKNPTNLAKSIIKKLDISGDKKLNRDEFIKGLKGDEVITQLLAPK